MTAHQIRVYRDEPGLERLRQHRPLTAQDRLDHYVWHIECSDPVACPGFQECREPHKVGGVDADDGPWDAPEDAPWDGYDVFTFHGVPHEWHDGWGWTVPYRGCPVSGSDLDLPDGVPTEVDGTYPVLVEWDDDDCWITLKDLTPSQGGTPS